MIDLITNNYAEGIIIIIILYDTYTHPIFMNHTKQIEYIVYNSNEIT